MGGINFKSASPYIIVALLFVLGVGLNAILSARGEGPKAPGTEAVAGEYQLASFKCAQCHEMWPYISTWMFSFHNKISCESCHTNIDLAAMEKAHATGDYRKPISLKVPIDRGVCLGCHDGYRVPSMPGDLKDPHLIHFKADIQCVACHSGATHFNINERNLFQLPQFSNYSNWRPDLVKTIATLPYSRPTMGTCFQCHETVFNPNYNPEKPTKPAYELLPCTACHTQYTNPSQLPPSYR
ncbi:hypothetical protein [Desulfothermobacter acidiphilus]|uniref:hypothetical protein n=1 Tax=Desulfothermobacter acidiphilus TaxID=1938353 RepID=UPI003F8867C5